MPFFSLLEAKFFKYFLEGVLTGIWELITTVFVAPEEKKELALLREAETSTRKLIVVGPDEEQRYIRIAEEMIIKHGKAIDAILANSLKKNLEGLECDPLIMASLAYIISPS